MASLQSNGTTHHKPVRAFGTFGRCDLAEANYLSASGLLQTAILHYDHLAIVQVKIGEQPIGVALL